MLTHSAKNFNECLNSLGFLFILLDIENKIVTLKTLSFKFELCLTKFLKNIYYYGII